MLFVSTAIVYIFIISFVVVSKFLGDQEVEIPAEDDQADLLIDFKKAGKQNLLVVVNGRGTKGHFVLEALSEDLRVINTL